MTDPRDRAPEEPLEPVDDDIDDIDDDIDEDGERIDDADINAIDDDLADDDAVEAVDDYDAAVQEISGEGVAPAAGPSAGERRAAQRRGSTKATRAPSPSEVAVHVREDVSKFFVIATVAVFVLILLNGLLLGTGGLLRPLATPTTRKSAGQ